MITAIAIENFNAGGERVRVELKPLTSCCSSGGSKWR